MTEQSPEFAGLTALVTGGASGIGLATARLLAARGARVAVLDRMAEDRDGPPGTAIYPVLADVTDDAAVRAAVAEAGQALGRLDILVNNAGVGAAGTVEDNDDDEWHRVLDVNVLGIVRTTRAALPLLRQAAPSAARPRSSTPARSRPPRACRSGRCTARARAPSTRSRWPWRPITWPRASG